MPLRQLKTIKKCYIIFLNEQIIYLQYQNNFIKMWKTPQKSPATTIAATQPPASARSQQMFNTQIRFPMAIANNPQYTRLYDKIYKSEEKCYNSMIQQQNKSRVKSIKDTIAQKILSTARQNSFTKKFSSRKSHSAKKMIKNGQTLQIGQTKLQQNYEKLNFFLMDHRNAVQLQQQSRLAQYHLRDQQKNRSKIDYINRVQLTSKHRRTDPYLKDRQFKLFRPNNQMNYHLLRKTAYIRNDKLMQKSLINAKNNPTYCRMKNFQQIQFILDEDNKNLMMTRDIPRDSATQNKYNQNKKIFINFAYVSDSTRVYYQYIRQKQYEKLIDLIVPQNQTQRQKTKVTKQYVHSIIKKITKYKQNKVLHFQDFVQLIQTIKQEKCYNFVNILIQKCKHNKALNRKYSHSELDQLLQSHSNKHHINSILHNSKFAVIVHKIYEKYSQKIVGRLYLPLRQIIDAMKNAGVVPKLISMPKFTYHCNWFQMRRQGFTQEQFINIQIAIGVQNGGISGLEKYFKRFDQIQILNS